MDKSLSVMRLRLKQQSTACYGFPLALQLFAFKAIPSLLEKIPEPNKTTSFLQEPEGCDSTNALLNFEDILLVETQTEVIVTYSIPDEGGDPKWKKEVIDPQIDNLVRRMREGHEFKATDFRGGDSSLPPLKPAEKAEGVGVKKKCQKPSRRFGKACDEPGSSTQAPERPIRPRRGICKQAEPGNLSDKEQVLKEWIRVELKTQLGKLRNEIFDWLHHDRGGSSTVPQNTAAGKKNRDNSHADPTGMEVPKKRRPLSGDGNDEAEIFGSDSKKHKKNNGNGFSDDETMRMHDNHCDGHSMAGEGPSFSKSANIPEVDVSTPIGPETVSKPAKPTLPEPLEVNSSVGIFNVCIGNDKEASKLFQQFEANHYDLRSDAIVGLGADLEWRLISFGAPYMNRYGASFKFPDDEVIKSPSCLYGHDYTVDFEGSCKKCRLFWICCNISHIL
ncbi:hypothetical protein F2Q69_00004407 [Brassica cretica]|uniref:Uncharacterized protein n=1 Tax=Brassica cretica TaxID=69181 RepID=A0A8S9P4R4_BRACR|nr:hypothetical protein F2Q69_00004407 [Brassica cretica]